MVLDKMGEARPPPWHFPGCDLSDYFNYGMDPESWRFYCAIVAAFRCAPPAAVPWSCKLFTPRDILNNK